MGSDDEGVFRAELPCDPGTKDTCYVYKYKSNAIRLNRINECLDKSYAHKILLCFYKSVGVRDEHFYFAHRWCLGCRRALWERVVRKMMNNYFWFRVGRLWIVDRLVMWCLS